MARKSDNTIKAGFAERLNQALDKEGFPPRFRGRIQLIAEMFDLSHRGVGKWLSGETCPPAKKYPIIAEKLNVSTEWLRTGSGDMLREERTTSAPNRNLQHDVPLLKVADLDNPEATSKQHFTCYINNVGRSFALKVDSEAMSPRFPPGSIIIVDTGRTAKDGDFVLVESSAQPSLIFRQLLISGELKYLNAHNPKFDRLMLSTKDKIKGVVIQAVLMFSA